MKYCTICKDKFDDTLSFCPKDGEVLEEDAASLVGTVLDGQYQIEALLGKGGMGAVYKARHILLGDRVAIKLLPPEMRSNTEWLRRFQREGQAARRFRHHNAVTVYDLRTSADGTIYLVMEYVDGTTLDAELKKRKSFSPTEALTVLDPIMSVLNAAHAMGVVHRDLKPENIMIGKASTGGEPVVKLLDLGIAKLREVAGAEKTGNTALTIAGQMLGTPYYMSPEQWGELPDDGNSEIDGRADIYSLGVVFYELITGKRPFTGATLSELRRQHISITPPPLYEVVPGVPEGFSQAIARAIAKDRSERQGTADELKNELGTALAAGEVSPSASIADRPTGVAATISSATGRSTQDMLTSAERTASTIVGDSALTEVEKAAPANAMSAAEMQSQAATLPTMVVSEQELAARAAARATGPAPAFSTQPDVLAPPVVPAPRRSPLLFVGIGIVALLLVVGVGGYAVIHFMGSSTRNVPSRTGPSDGPTGTDLSAGAHEIGRYWLEVDTKDKSDSLRASDPMVMKSGQSFKFHFNPSENGYLYIIGPGNKNAPTMFLSAKPSPQFGAKTNEAKSGVDFPFPADTGTKENWLTLDSVPGTDEFTIVFSASAMTTPAFLAGPAEHELTADEQKQLDDLRTQFKANSVGTEVIKTGASPSISVKVPQNAEGMPVIFKLRIEHK